MTLVRNRESYRRVSGDEASAKADRQSHSSSVSVYPVSDNAEPQVAELDHRPRLWHRGVTLSLTTWHPAAN